ncbi:hypothetical protein R70199_03689 [Paraburkholderia domus]|nr:hypothetical protein R70199_03689 [Paraburkholderia domus]
MSKRWLKTEDNRIARQLKKGIAIGEVLVPDRKKADIRKRAYRIGLLVKYEPAIEKRVAQWAAVKTSLEAGDKSRKQLAIETGMTDDTIRRVLDRHRAELHIADWVYSSPSALRRSSMWRLGAGEDAVAPDGIVTVEKGTDPEAAMLSEARQRLREIEARGELIRRDPYVEALFGRYKAPGSDAGQSRPHNAHEKKATSQGGLCQCTLLLLLGTATFDQSLLLKDTDVVLEVVGLCAGVVVGVVDDGEKSESKRA